MLRTVISWIAIVFWTTVFGIWGVFLSIVLPSRVTRYAIRPWAQLVLKSCGVKVELEGVENLPKEPSIIMYNHQSTFDIFAFAASLPIEWKAVMKQEVASIPFVGWVSKLTGHYFVARDNSSKDVQEIRKLVEKIKSGPSVLIAPEGTRSSDGKLLPFKKGGFVVAMYAGVPVVPMVITGGKDIMPKGSLSIRPGTIRIKILPPIDTKKLPAGKEGREELLKLVREAMLGVLDDAESKTVDEVLKTSHTV
jgi:1-acyl-sn-glycerol-3-phosphate acyltransferase